MTNESLFLNAWICSRTEPVLSSSAAESILVVNPLHEEVHRAVLSSLNHLVLGFERKKKFSDSILCFYRYKSVLLMSDNLCFTNFVSSRAPIEGEKGCDLFWQIRSAANIRLQETKQTPSHCLKWTLFLRPHRPFFGRAVDVVVHVTVDLHRRGGACRINGVHAVQTRPGFVDVAAVWGQSPRVRCRGQQRR